MKELLCFDVDGTLLTNEMKSEGEYIKGIIPTKLLIDLWEKGYKIAIVSPSPFLPQQFSGKNHWFKRNGSNDYRWENIMDAREYYKTPLIDTIYIDDLESNRNNVKLYVRESYSPEEFISKFLKRGIEDDKKPKDSGVLY